MPPDYFPIERFSQQPNNSIAITVCKPKRGSLLHCGIVFNYKNSLIFLHLASHRYLKLDGLQDILSDNENALYTNFAHLIKNDKHFFLRKSLIALMFAIMEKNKNTIPYSFLFKDTKFNQNNELILGKNEYGLTCSTFVLAVFERHSLTICNKESWPPREDDKIMQQQIIDLLSENPHIDKSHIEIMKKDIGCVRFRPEEVLSASSRFPLPCKFENAKEFSEVIRDHLQN